MAQFFKKKPVSIFNAFPADEVHLTFIKKDIENSKTPQVQVNNPIVEEIEKKEETPNPKRPR